MILFLTQLLYKMHGENRCVCIIVGFTKQKLSQLK